MYVNYTVDQIEKLTNGFIQNTKVDFNFPKQMEMNYLKIISNTFYLCLKQTALEIKEIYNKDEFSSLSKEDKLQKIRTTYMKNLTTHRQNVISFFKVEEPQGLIDLRTCLRMYTHSLDLSSQVRIKYSELNSTLDEIELNMIDGIFPTEYIYSEDSNWMNSPRNEEIDLKRLTKNTIDFKRTIS